jgi:hypothetical protein
LSAPRRLVLALSPSRGLAILLLSAHVAAAVCAWMVTPGILGALLAAALAGLGVASAWSRALLRAPRSVRGLVIDGSALTLQLTSGESLAAELSPRCFVGRFLVTLPLRRPRRTLLVTPDMLDPQAFRRLRVWALWGRLPAVAPAQLTA